MLTFKRIRFKIIHQVPKIEREGAGVQEWHSTGAEGGGKEARGGEEAR